MSEQLPTRLPPEDNNPDSQLGYEYVEEYQAREAETLKEMESPAPRLLGRMALKFQHKLEPETADLATRVEQARRGVEKPERATRKPGEAQAIDNINSLAQEIGAIYPRNPRERRTDWHNINRGRSRHLGIRQKIANALDGRIDDNFRYQKRLSQEGLEGGVQKDRGKILHDIVREPRARGESVEDYEDRRIDWADQLNPIAIRELKRNMLESATAPTSKRVLIGYEGFDKKNGRPVYADERVQMSEKEAKMRLTNTGIVSLAPEAVAAHFGISKEDWKANIDKREPVNHQPVEIPEEVIEEVNRIIRLDDATIDQLCASYEPPSEQRIEERLYRKFENQETLRRKAGEHLGTAFESYLKGDSPDNTTIQNLAGSITKLNDQHDNITAELATTQAGGRKHAVLQRMKETAKNQLDGMYFRLGQFDIIDSTVPTTTYMPNGDIKLQDGTILKPSVSFLVETPKHDLKGAVVDNYLNDLKTWFLAPTDENAVWAESSARSLAEIGPSMAAMTPANRAGIALTNISRYWALFTSPNRRGPASGADIRLHSDGSVYAKMTHQGIEGEWTFDDDGSSSVVDPVAGKTRYFRADGTEY